jgi:hypothetical protein
MTGVDDKPHFVGWLQQQNPPEAQYALVRHFNAPLPNTGKKSNMSGHFHSGFFGIRVFLRTHTNYQTTLQALAWTDDFWDKHPQLKQDFRQFVVANWASFPGPAKGSWLNKISPTLGGVQSRGGGSSGLLSRMLILLDRYGNQQGY